MQASRILLGLGMTLAATGAARAASVSFDPPGDSVIAGTAIFTDVSVAVGSLSDFDFAYINIGSDDATDLSFGYDTDWSDAFANVSGPDYDAEGIYLQEVVLGANNNDEGVGMSSLTVGTLAIDTTGMAVGTYTVSVDYDRDGSSELADLGEESQHDPLYGSFQFTIVPEPATVSLVLLAALALRRPRSR